MNKKGFTIVEAIIALVIISFVALISMPIITISKNVTESSRSKFMAINFCDNSIAVFRSIDDKNTLDEFYTDFSNRINSALGFELPALADDGTTIYLDKNWQQTKISNATTECSFLLKQSGSFVTLTVTVNDINGETIYSATHCTIVKESV